MELTTTSGSFWVGGSPDTRVHGELSALTGAHPEVTLEADLIDDPRIRKIPGGVAFSGTAEDSVAAFLPITVHGQLDTGEQITMLDARNHGGAGQLFRGAPRYVAHTAVLGAHIDADRPVHSIRFQVGNPYWFDHLRAEDSAVTGHDAALGVEASQDGNWLTYRPTTPETLRRLRVLVVSGVQTLMELAFDQKFDAQDVQLQVVPDGPWLPLLTDASGASTAKINPDSLLPRDVLTLQIFADWIALNDRLDGLAAAVVSPVKGALQAEALVITSLVEGIHRRLPYQQSKFPNITKEVRRAILDAARRAGRVEVEARGIDPEIVNDSIQFFADVSFGMRATEIVNEVCSVIPEIAESVADLPRQITKVRNDIAHHLPIGTKEPLEVAYLRWLIVVTATPWLLRALLLLHAGIPAEVVREGCLESDRFAYVRANVAQFVRELGWKLPPTPD